MWAPQYLTTLWAFTACYRDTFTFSLFISNAKDRHWLGITDITLHRLTQYCLLSLIHCSEFKSTLTWQLKAGIVQSEQTSIARQWLGNHVSAVMNINKD
jgi:hypothetical protein